ncbi:aminoglycoside phosphotransferase family protein [Azospirillum sp.]|uniref:aminoglycoside phosphotransferase family protein n=1 Tax=Azospirillum sp. TaxID=34012 RepID=UPI002D3097B8|nr:aminoglycoside phosphotransferase family protein [Azospirillum sp.]HYD68822.1 aminoglycoside phosphotransferase family protein [Azospirillum sp.]
MFLTVSNIAHFLMERGILDARSIVGGDFSVAEAGRRCRNFKITRGGLPGLFVKQIMGHSPEHVATLRREAAFYQLVATRPLLEPLKTISPTYVDFDAGRHALVLGLLPQAENLNELHFRLRRFPVEVGELLGRGLGAYHAQAANALLEPVNAQVFPRQPPWIFTLDPATLAPLPSFPPHIGRPMMEMLSRRPDLLAHLHALGREYEFSALIHGDMKWDNFIVHPAGPNGEYDFKVIDWELVDLGDAAWDIACILTSYILYVMLIPPQAGTGPAAEDRKDRTLAEAVPSMRRFWQVYVETRGFGEGAARVFLTRCMRHVGARLVVAVFEALFNRSALAAQAETLMETARAFLWAPDKAAADLLGTPS